MKPATKKRATTRIGTQFKARRLASTQSEKSIELQIMQYLKYKGIFCWKVENGGVFDVRRNAYRSNHAIRMRGISDICGCLPGGRLLAIEVKSAKGKLSPHQVTFIEEIKKIGGLAFVARSIEDVIANLKFSEK